MDYEDIINLPRHESTRFPKMKAADRAAQFAPFAALNGFGDAIAEAGRRYREAFEKEGSAEMPVAPDGEGA